MAFFQASDSSIGTDVDPTVPGGTRRSDCGHRKRRGHYLIRIGGGRFSLYEPDPNGRLQSGRKTGNERTGN